MKRAISLMLALVLCLSLCACDGGTESVTPNNSENGNVSNVTTPMATNPPTTEPVTPAAEPIQVGGTISLNYAELTLDALELSDGYEFEYTDKSSGITVTRKASIDCPTGMKLICLKGKFTNMSKKEVYPSNNPAHGTFFINGYEYEARMRCYIAAEAESLMGIAPLREVDCFIYAEIPEKLASQIETCELYIGFVKDLDPSVWVRDMGDYDALYLLEATPTK